MISNKNNSRPANKTINWIVRLLLLISIGSSGCLILASTQKDVSQTVVYLCAFYSFAIFLFFIAQLIGFVVCQTHYSDEVEDPKFALFGIEESEWKNYLKK